MSVLLTVVGDSLLDRDLDGRATRLAPDAPVPVVEDPVGASRPGGAGLAAVLAARAGADVTLITAIGHDTVGAELRSLLCAAGIRLIDLGHDGATAEKVRVRASGSALLRLDRGCDAAPPGSLNDAACAAIHDADAVLVSDYGRGITRMPRLRSVLAARAAAAPVVWDPHPRGATPVRGTVVTPNRAEAMRVLRERGASRTPSQWAARLCEQWAARGVMLTLGGSGALLVESGHSMAMALPVTCADGDPCGAGDCLAVTLAVSLASGVPLQRAAMAAVRAATAFVEAGGVAALDARARADASETENGAVVLAENVRARGGVVVATGGCFDLLHAGHLATLEAARRMGDCLIVCMNSDESVRRLKGTGRPLVTEDDRAAVLEALRCVDAVEVFDEVTPDAVLRRLRPHVWVKGGDYSQEQLPERDVLAEWGGEAVVVPYMNGRSTTRLVALARRSA